MQIFLYEYTCGGGTALHPLAAALQAEGWAMLSALLEDFQRVSGVETRTMMEASCRYQPPGGICRRVQAADQEQLFRELAGAADGTLVIAPEFDDILRTRCRWVLEAGGRLLGSSLAAVNLTSDKLALSRHLRSRGVPTPESHLWIPGDETTPDRFPAVWKPRSGAGSQATFLVKDLQALRDCHGLARAEGWQGEALVQSYVPGQPASVAFLVGRRHVLPLLPATQRLSQDGRLRYRGGSIPLPADLAQRARKAAKQAIEAVPGLRGYVGVDLVLGHAEDGSKDAVIEINARPTTSYVGLRALAQTNLAEALLQVALRDELPNLGWQSRAVQFDANGAVAFDPN